MPYRKLFLSRWSALLWAAGILWTAVDAVGFASSSPQSAANASDAADQTDATGVEVNSADLTILANVMKDN